MINVSNKLFKCCTLAVFLTTVGMVQAADHGDMKGSDSLMHTMKDGMQKMDSMKMSGDVDKDYAMMMKMHHQQALEMAQIELDQGKSAEMKSMAKKIISSQKKEIAEFENWLSKQK